jgi:hypothetical protein
MAMLKASHLPTDMGLSTIDPTRQMTVVSKGNNQADEAARAAVIRDLDLFHPLQDETVIFRIYPKHPNCLSRTNPLKLLEAFSQNQTTLELESRSKVSQIYFCVFLFY